MKLQFATVGGAEKVVMVGISKDDADYHVLVCTDGSKHIAQEIETKVKQSQLAHILKIITVHAFNVHDISSKIINNALEFFEDQKKINKIKKLEEIDFTFNFTGGTSIMTSGMLIAAYLLKGNAFLVKPDLPDEEIIKLDLTKYNGLYNRVDLEYPELSIDEKLMNRSHWVLLETLIHLEGNPEYKDGISLINLVKEEAKFMLDNSITYSLTNDEITKYTERLQKTKELQSNTVSSRVDHLQDYHLVISNRKIKGRKIKITALGKVQAIYLKTKFLKNV
jgi:hypothetical protein